MVTTKMKTASTDILALEERYQLATYKKMPIVAERGEGVWLYAANGQRYLDLYGGHAGGGTGPFHPQGVAAICEKTREILFYSNLGFSPDQGWGAAQLVSVAPLSLRQGFL